MLEVDRGKPFFVFKALIVFIEVSGKKGFLVVSMKTA